MRGLDIKYPVSLDQIAIEETSPYIILRTPYSS